MPRRPRQHQLESESRNALNAKLSEVNWVLEDFDNDYGLDGEVEVFRETHSTRLRFFVQLKATDGEQLSFRLRRSQWQYYEGLDLPVLIVFYKAKAGSLYSRWFHRFPPRVGLGNDEPKTRTFRLSESDLWVESRPEELCRELRSMKYFRSTDPALPMRVSAIAPEHGAWGHSRTTLLSRLRSAASRMDHLLVFDSRISDDAVAIAEIDQDQIAARVPGLRDVVASVPDGYPSGGKLEGMANDVLVLVALASFRAGQSRLAAGILSRALEQSYAVRNPIVAIEASVCFAHADQTRRALEISRNLNASIPEEAAGAEFLRLAAGNGSSVMTDTDAQTMSAAEGAN